MKLNITIEARFTFMIKFFLLEGILKFGHSFKELLSYDRIALALAWPHVKEGRELQQVPYLYELIFLLIDRT